jgi:hypothetical protein
VSAQNYQSGRWEPEHATNQRSSWAISSNGALRVVIDIDLQLAEEAARHLCATSLEDTIHAALDAAASGDMPARAWRRRNPEEAFPS